jgi:hypothetical protein
MRRFFCPACGCGFSYDETAGGYLVRDSSHPTPGRMRFIVGGLLGHECRDGEFTPPGEVAEPRGW